MDYYLNKIKELLLHVPVTDVTDNSIPEQQIVYQKDYDLSFDESVETVKQILSEISIPTVDKILDYIITGLAQQILAKYFSLLFLLRNSLYIYFSSPLEEVFPFFLSVSFLVFTIILWNIFKTLLIKSFMLFSDIFYILKYIYIKIKVLIKKYILKEEIFLEVKALKIIVPQFLKQNVINNVTIMHTHNYLLHSRSRFSSNFRKVSNSSNGVKYKFFKIKKK